jgi:short subunit dehydrogenase-like uncharacterized protein
VRRTGSPRTPTSRKTEGRFAIFAHPVLPRRSSLLNGTILIYGSTGYTGKLIAKTAADQGARPILAGRNLARVNAVARPLDLKARAFDLGDPARIDAAFKGVSAVLNAAGPFINFRSRLVFPRFDHT